MLNCSSQTTVYLEWYYVSWVRKQIIIAEQGLSAPEKLIYIYHGY